ncbi:DUF3862 domain-containing protein [Chitinibacteraceae bacterium HSL-7]
MRKLLPLALLVLLAACSKVTPENFAKIDTGMSREEVVKVLGEPDSADGASLLGLSGESAVWKSRKATITIAFVNGHVVTKNIASN